MTLSRIEDLDCPTDFLLDNISDSILTSRHVRLARTTCEAVSHDEQDETFVQQPAS